MSLHKELKKTSFCFVPPQFVPILFYEIRLHLDNKNKSLLVFYFVLCSVCTTLLRQVRLHLNNKNPLSFYFVLCSVCTTLLRQVRLYLNNKNKNPLSFYFVLCSVCTNFVRNLENKTNLSW